MAQMNKPPAAPAAPAKKVMNPLRSQIWTLAAGVGLLIVLVIGVRIFSM